MAKNIHGPLSYLGVEANFPPNLVVHDRAPLSRDYKKFDLGSIWMQKETENIWMLTDKQSGVATWTKVTTGGIATFTDITITPGDLTVVTGDINVTAGDIIITGGALTLEAINFASTLRTLADGTVYGIADTGTPAVGTAEVYHSNSVGATQWGTVLSAGGTVTVTTTAAGINLEAAGGTAANTYTTDDAVVVLPDGAGNVTVAGGTNITTAGAAHTLTFNLDDSITLANTLTVSNGGANITGNVSITGNATVTVDLLVQGGLVVDTLSEGVILSDAAGAFTSSPGTLGYVLTSTGAGSVPTWQAAAGGGGATTFDTDGASATVAVNTITIAGGTNIATSGAGSTVTVAFDGTLPVTSGGTGLASITDHGVMLGSGAGNVSVTAVGTAGYLLTSNGAGVDPTWQATATMQINTVAGAAYTFILTDASKEVIFTSAAAVAVTIPTNAVVAFPVGTNILLFQDGVGAVTVSGAVGVTLKSAGTRTILYEQYSSAGLIKVAADEWQLVGDIR